jgi:hypothetical protein
MALWHPSEYWFTLLANYPTRRTAIRHYTPIAGPQVAMLTNFLLLGCYSV